MNKKKLIIMLKTITCIFQLQKKSQDQYRQDFKKMRENKKLEIASGLVNVQFTVVKCGTLKMMLNELSD
ncbi:hypothetical protein HX837_08220 [Marine Group I thaumarchaeote]|uniref:Uncharacterized protein n=1 Tax=Marine Group I thaumarchaeote TaxID=2511932 RepID=A0A7K4MRH0_9ARCH|nr:hypothetical protein [Marine Group I thaumarchaeote]